MTVEMPEIVMVPRNEIRPNPWNPNSMDPDIFNELVSNIETDGFIQPIAIGPIEDDPEGYKWEIIDGEHRFDGLVILDVEEIPCYVRNIDEDKRKFLTVKMNRLRGKMDRKKFTKLVEDLMQRHTFEEVAEQMAFTDPTELEALMESTRESLPTKEMRDEFDAAKKDIKTVDDLSLLLNRLFTKFGDTLPANFMILDFGGKEHIWVRMERNQYQTIREKAREILGHGYTFDSFIAHLLTVVPVERTIDKYKDFLAEAKAEASSGDVVDIDDILKAGPDEI